MLFKDDGESKMTYQYLPDLTLHKFKSIDLDHAASAAVVLQSEDYRAVVIGCVVLVEYRTRTKVIEDIQMASQSTLEPITQFDKEYFNKMFNTNY